MNSAVYAYCPFQPQRLFFFQVFFVVKTIIVYSFLQGAFLKSNLQETADCGLTKTKSLLITFQPEVFYIYSILKG